VLGVFGLWGGISQRKVSSTGTKWKAIENNCEALRKIIKLTLDKNTSNGIMGTTPKYRLEISIMPKEICIVLGQCQIYLNIFLAS
jgi:hypothetical protein